MSLRHGLLVALSSALLGSTAASAALVAVTSYDMNNGNGAIQFTEPTGAQNYFDWTYTQNGQSSPAANASKNGSSLLVPNNSAPKEAPLTGGTGLLTDGVRSSVNFSMVSSPNGVVSGYTGFASVLNGPSQYVGWKYQDPTILFHLAPNQMISQISLYVASDNSGGLVGAPRNVTLTIGGVPVLASAYNEAVSPYMDSISTIGASIITLTLNQAVSSNLTFGLQLFRGPLQADGIDYYNNHVKGFDPLNPTNASNCVGFCDPDSGPFSSGFRTEAALGQTGVLAPNSGLEPWIMLSEVTFTAAVPEPSTWLMMIAGFAGLGFLGYRRKIASSMISA